jgi:hypothetical protein
MHHDRRASTQLLALMGVLGVVTIAAGVAPVLVITRHRALVGLGFRPVRGARWVAL